MSQNKFNLADVIRIAVAAIRAAYGDYSAALAEGGSRTVKVIVVIVIGFLMLFTVLVGSLTKLMPDFPKGG